MKPNEIYLISKLAKYRTNHILHLILSIMTGGLWIFIWFLVAMKNRVETKDIERKIKSC